jgi:hypothetical protein
MKALTWPTQRNLAVSVPEIVTDFNITEELAASMPMKGTTTGVGLYEEVKKVLQRLVIPVQMPAGQVTHGAEVTVACLPLSSTT